MKPARYSSLWGPLRLHNRLSADLGDIGLTAMLVGLAAMCALVAGLVVERPITFPDEAVYYDLARSIASGRGFEVAGHPFSPWTFGPLYPLLLAPLVRLAPTAHGTYLAIRAVNALLFASAAVPLRLIAARFLSRRGAFLVAIAGVSLPAVSFTTRMETESLAYPAALCTVLAAVRVFVAPTTRRQLVLVAAVVAASLCRIELAALGVALVAGCVLGTPGPFRARCRRFAILLFALAVPAGLIAVTIVVTLASNRSSHGFDAGTFSPLECARLFLGTTSALALYTGLIPFARFAGILVKPRRREGDETKISLETQVDAFVVFTALTVVALTALSSLYLAGVPGAYRVSAPTDRYVVYAAPMVLIVFAYGIERGVVYTRVQRRVAATATGLSLAVIAALALERQMAPTSGGLGIMPWLLWGRPDAQWWLLPFAGSCAYCLLVVARTGTRAAQLVRPAIWISGFATLACFAYGASGSTGAVRISPPIGWLDRYTRTDVVALVAGSTPARRAFALWEVDATNESRLTGVYYLRRPDRLGRDLERKATVGPRRELLSEGHQIAARYALTTTDAAAVVGVEVARSHGLTLYRVEPPLRLRATRDR